MWLGLLQCYLEWKRENCCSGCGTVSPAIGIQPEVSTWWWWGGCTLEDVLTGVWVGWGTWGHRDSEVRGGQRDSQTADLGNQGFWNDNHFKNVDATSGFGFASTLTPIWGPQQWGRIISRCRTIVCRIRDDTAVSNLWQMHRDSAGLLGQSW